MGKTIHYFQTIDSTNSEAYQLALQGAEEGEVVIAESQKKGRGRLGRHWFSPPFLNLYLSVILRPRIPPSSGLPHYPDGSRGHGGCDSEVFGLLPLIKWPNDILLGDRKVAGLLNEIHSETDRIHFVILGHRGQPQYGWEDVSQRDSGRGHLVEEGDGTDDFEKGVSSDPF